MEQAVDDLEAFVVRSAKADGVPSVLREITNTLDELRRYATFPQYGKKEFSVDRRESSFGVREYPCSSHICARKGKGSSFRIDYAFFVCSQLEGSLDLTPRMIQRPQVGAFEPHAATEELATGAKLVCCSAGLARVR